MPSTSCNARSHNLSPTKQKYSPHSGTAHRQDNSPTCIAVLIKAVETPQAPMRRGCGANDAASAEIEIGVGATGSILSSATDSSSSTGV